MTRHGHSRRNAVTKLYKVWRSMLARCKNPNSASWQYYGAKGIKVCWESFDEFLADMGPSFDGKMTIDRIDSQGNYEKQNCRWASAQEQARNKKTSRKITFNGRCQNASQWADELGLKRITLYRRLWNGWTIEKALTTVDGRNA